MVLSDGLKMCFKLVMMVLFLIVDDVRMEVNRIELTTTMFFGWL